MSTLSSMEPSIVVLFLVGLWARVQSLELTDEFLDRLVGLEIQNAAYNTRIQQLEKSRCGSTRGARELQNGAPVAFTAYLATDLDNQVPKTPIVFEKVLLNEGNAYDNTTGIFTAPVQGAYYFSFFIGEKDDEQFNTMLTVNHENVVGAAAEGIADGHDDQGGNAATIQLNIGDIVQVVHRHVGTHVEGSSALRLSTFSGFLLYATDHPGPSEEPSIIG